MSKKEVDQIYIFQFIVNGSMTQKKAAEILKLSPRQVNRKLRRYIAKGSFGLAHKNRGKPSNRRLPEQLVNKIIELLTTIYHGLGPTLASEKLAERHQIFIDHETLRRLMILRDLWKPCERKNIRHVWRERKWHFGELVQIDGSLHIWFGEQYSTLIAFIDDATSRVELLFADHETVKSLSAIMQKYLEKYGRPRALYADRGKVYKVNMGTNKELRRTEFQRMLKELDISIIHAMSPQAKGRVERLFRTLQDRLVKELALQNIKTIDAANKFLQEVYIEKINQKLEVPAKSDVNLHRSIEGFNLHSIFCVKRERILNNDRTICYLGRWFFLSKEQPVKLYKGCKITVCRHFDKTISLMVNQHRLNYREIIKPAPLAKKQEVKYCKEIRPYKPPRNHPWRDIGKFADISKEFKT